MLILFIFPCVSFFPLFPDLFPWGGRCGGQASNKSLARPADTSSPHGQRLRWVYMHLKEAVINSFRSLKTSCLCRPGLAQREKGNPVILGSIAGGRRGRGVSLGWAFSVPWREKVVILLSIKSCRDLLRTWTLSVNLNLRPLPCSSRIFCYIVKC